MKNRLFGKTDFIWPWIPCNARARIFAGCTHLKKGLEPDVISEEQKAIEKLKQGHIKGLEALVQLHQLRAIRTAYAITNSREIAEDVVADAFLIVFDRIGQFDPSRPFTPWFYRIVVNRATKAVRDVRRRGTKNGVVHEILEQQPDTEPGPEEKALLAEMRKILDVIVQTLPPEQRATLLLRYYLQMTESEIAQTLECPLGTVKWRLYTARMKLRQVLVKSPDFFLF